MEFKKNEFTTYISKRNSFLTKDQRGMVKTNKVQRGMVELLGFKENSSLIGVEEGTVH